MKLSKVITEAIEIIDEGGWCQYQTTDDMGRHCAFGAVSVVIIRAGLRYHGPEHLRANAALNSAVDVETNEVYGSMLIYNDSRGRTWPEVRAVMVHAAKTLATANA